MEIRRVVTGHDDQGRAVFARDEAVDGYRPPLMPATLAVFIVGAHHDGPVPLPGR